jgi:hypothetical protein
MRVDVNSNFQNARIDNLPKPLSSLNELIKTELGTIRLYSDGTRLVVLGMRSLVTEFIGIHALCCILSQMANKLLHLVAMRQNSIENDSFWCPKDDLFSIVIFVKCVNFMTNNFIQSR